MDLVKLSCVEGSQLVEEAVQLAEEAKIQQDLDMAKANVRRSYATILVLPFPDGLVDSYVAVLRTKRQLDLPKLVDLYIKEIRKILEF